MSLPARTNLQARGPWRRRAQARGTPQRATPAQTAQRHNSYPFYAFRLWHGMTTSVLLRMLARHGFAVSPSRIPLVALGLFYALNNSAMSTIQSLIFGRRIAASTLSEPPIFIIGHWRTGTTHLHELLALDESFTAPSTLECLAPTQCLAFGWLIRWLAFLLPATRPMDNMPVGWEQPQEEELALMTLGLGSPYEALMFPNHRRPAHAFLNMTGPTPTQVAAWKAGLLAFLQQVNYRGQRGRKGHGAGPCIVLKSPTHTARLHVLRDMFPQAKFIHVVRDPRDVFASTIRLWRALYGTQGCQAADDGARPDGTPAIEDYVLESMNELYRDFFSEAARIPAGNFCQVRYEDLVRTPVAELSRIYRELALPSFERMRPRLEAHLQELAGYRPNQHRIADEQTAAVARSWGWYMEKFGYQSRAGAAAEPANN